MTVSGSHGLNGEGLKMVRKVALTCGATVKKPRAGTRGDPPVDVYVVFVVPTALHKSGMKHPRQVKEDQGVGTTRQLVVGIDMQSVFKKLGPP